MYCWLFIVNFPTAQCQELYPSCDYTLPTSLHRLYVSSGKEGIWYIFYPQVKKPVSFWLVKKQLWISSVEWLIHHVFQWKHQQIIIHWNLYYAETLGECCSVHLIQSVRLIQVLIDNGGVHLIMVLCKVNKVNKFGDFRYCPLNRGCLLNTVSA